MYIKSTSFSDNSPIPANFTCKGGNSSPQLTIAAVPADAKSLALRVHDPDAPAGDFTHWLRWDIPPDTTTIPEASVPPGTTEGTNDAGKLGYFGPCPPKGTGTHHYIFELFALDASLSLPETATNNEFHAALQKRVIAHASLTGLVAAES